MRASPSCDIDLGRAPRWRLAVAVLAATSLACIVAWGFQAPATVSGAAWLALLGVGSIVVALAATLAWPVSGRLAWDGACWRLTAGRSGRAGPQTATGELTVATDLGFFMLLRFVADRDSGGGVRWLAVERRGREHHWHALRCAVYSPPPRRDLPAGAGRPAAE